MGDEFFHGQRPAEDQFRRIFLQIHGSAVAPEQTALAHANRRAGNLHDPVHNPNILREAAAGRLKSGSDPDLFVDRALRIEFPLAIEAVSARDVMKHHYAVAGRKLTVRSRKPPPGAHYHSSRLMSIDAWRGQKAVFETDRTQNRGIPGAAANWAPPPASISTAEAPPARRSFFSPAVCTTRSTEASTPVECGIALCGRRASNRRPAASTAVATKTSPIPSAGSSAPQNPILTIASGWHAGQATSTARPACAAPAPFATIHSCRPPDSPDLAQ